MASFQLPITKERVEIGQVMAGHLMISEPGGVATIHNSSVNARVFLALQPLRPGPEILGVLIRPGDTWSESWRSSSANDMVWCWSNRDDAIITVLLLKIRL